MPTVYLKCGGVARGCVVNNDSVTFCNVRRTDVGVPIRTALHEAIHLGLGFRKVAKFNKTVKSMTHKILIKILATAVVQPC